MSYKYEELFLQKGQDFILICIWVQKMSIPHFQLVVSWHKFFQDLINEDDFIEATENIVVPSSVLNEMIEISANDPGQVLGVKHDGKHLIKIIMKYQDSIVFITNSDLEKVRKCEVFVF